MTAKEYLERAYCTQRRINNNIKRLEHWETLATKVTPTLSDVPPSGTGSDQRLETVIVKIVDLKNEIQADISDLVDIEKEIVGTIKKLNNPKDQAILELKYLCGGHKSWSDVAYEMGYSVSHIYHIRNEAYSEVEKIINNEKMIEKDKNNNS